MQVVGEVGADPTVNADDVSVHIDERATGVSANQSAVGAQYVSCFVNQSTDANDQSSISIESTGVSDSDYPLSTL